MLALTTDATSSKKKAIRIFYIRYFYVQSVAIFLLVLFMTSTVWEIQKI